MMLCLIRKISKSSPCYIGNSIRLTRPAIGSNPTCYTLLLVKSQYIFYFLIYIERIIIRVKKPSCIFKIQLLFSQGFTLQMSLFLSFYITLETGTNHVFSILYIDDSHDIQPFLRYLDRLFPD